MSWITKLQSRWQVSTLQVVKILVVFACTGMTVVWLKNPILSWLPIDPEPRWLFSLTYFIVILPIYNVVLLIYGFILGEFDFFWVYEKRFLKRIMGKKHV